jgi:hypothetical protein
MRIELKALGFQSGIALKDFVIRKLSAALAHGAKEVKRVIVRLSDLNGPKGGVDKECRVELVFHRGQPQMVAATANDYFSAVHLAARRAGRISLQVQRRTPL